MAGVAHACAILEESSSFFESFGLFVFLQVEEKHPFSFTEAVCIAVSNYRIAAKNCCLTKVLRLIHITWSWTRFSKTI